MRPTWRIPCSQCAWFIIIAVYCTRTGEKVDQYYMICSRKNILVLIMVRINSPEVCAYYMQLILTRHLHACSQRELARTALSRAEHSGAAEHFNLALSWNPLDAESWFGLGFCELKRGPDRAGHAAVAFTRCVQADASHGEAWNNLGALHVSAGRYCPAFKALSVSIKLCQRSWQVR